MRRVIHRFLDCTWHKPNPSVSNDNMFGRKEKREKVFIGKNVMDYFRALADHNN